MSKTFDKIKDYLLGSKKRIEEIPEVTRQEMVESLKEMNNFDLYSIDISSLVESDVTMDGDTVKFKEGVEQKDEVGKYIMINGMKCREYQPWISGFTYKNVKDRYNYGEWLQIGFCDMGNFKKSITIEESGRPKECKLFPNEVSRLLGGHLYEIEESYKTFYKNKSKNNQLSAKEKIFLDTDRSDLYEFNNDSHTKHHNDTYSYKEGIFGTDKDGNYLSINGKSFHNFKPGMSGLAYVEFLSDGLLEPCLFLAEYKDGKMVGEGIIMSPTQKHIIRN